MALIALILCTGIREAEACASEVDDLRQRLGGELALHIRQGKGRVFQSFWRGGQALCGPLSVRAVENIVSQYPVVTERGKQLNVHPHDLRRTYARRLYEEGLDLVSISQNLGHASTRTMLLYIGELGADKRRAPGVYSFDLTALNDIEVSV